MGTVPLSVPKAKPVCTRTHALWVRVQTDTGTDRVKNTHGLPVSITSRNYKRKDKRRVTKFMPRNDGPYTVVRAFPEKSEYTLRLPNNPQTFPGFHSSLLKRFVPNDPTLFPNRKFTRPGAVVTEDGTEENMIDKIVDARHRGRGMQYLVRWVGYDRDHDEWLSGKMLEDTEALDIWEAENGTEV